MPDSPITRATHAIPPLPHERMRLLVPAFREVVARVVATARAKGFEAAGECLLDTTGGDYPDIERMAEVHFAFGQIELGKSPAAAEASTRLLLEHLGYCTNHELHRRRTFWVDESLAWMLAETRLDIEGRLLRLPFPASCFVFTDGRVREIGREVLRALGDAEPVVPALVAIYVFQIPGADGGRGIRAMVLLEEREDAWPTLISRDLLIQDDADLGEILESHFADVHDKDPFFESPALKELFTVLVNAILYVTCADVISLALETPLVKQPDRKAPPRGREAKNRRLDAAILERRFSADDVLHLPGKIPISRLRELEALVRGTDGPEVVKRWMVRGHWRRAPADWADRRLRWIEPYWKGPDIAVAIERQFILKA